MPSVLDSSRVLFGTIQVLTVALVSCCLSYIIDQHNFRSPLNLIWMTGFPIVLGLIVNEGWQAKWIMAASLLATSLVAVMISGPLLGVG